MITSHKNYREYLKSKLAEKVSANSRYSLRSFAKSLGLAHSSLAEILSGKKNLSTERAVVVAEKLRLNQQETEYFIQLIQYQNAKSESLKSIALDKLNAVSKQNSYFDLSINHFKMIAEWYHIPILYIIDLKNFVPTAANISAKLGVSEVLVESAVARLIRLDLLSINNAGLLQRTKNNLLVKSAAPNDALKSYHHQMLSLADQSLDQQTQKERFTSTRTFALNSNDLSKVADITREYLSKLCSIAEKSEDPDQLFHAFVNVFQLTDTKKECQ